MRWEPRRAMNNQSMNALEARISRLQPRRASKKAWRKQPYTVLPNGRRAKGNFKKPEEKTVFLAEFCYPFWVAVLVQR